MDLTLYKVGASGRVALGDLTAGVEFYNVEREVHDDDPGVPTGRIILTPVNVVAPNSKRAEEPPVTDTNSVDGNTPWIGN